MNDEFFMARAIELAQQGMEANAGGPFGAVVVSPTGEIIGEGWNQVTSSNDPTAHAEVTAIRAACKKLNSFQLDGCTVYTSCEPCPMCLGAIYWARPARVLYACTREDAARIGFDDRFIYDEIGKPLEDRQMTIINFMREPAFRVFERWMQKSDKTEY